MKRILVTYVVTLVIFLAFDAAWLSQAAGKLYRPTLGDILLDSFRITPAIVFYLLQMAGIMFFVMMPAFRNESWPTATLNGALFGLFTYATYDLTNYATLRLWSLQLTVLDMIWGTVVTAVSATLGFWISNLILK